MIWCLHGGYSSDDPSPPYPTTFVTSTSRIVAGGQCSDQWVASPSEVSEVGDGVRVGVGVEGTEVVLWPGIVGPWLGLASQLAYHSTSPS